MFPQQSSFSNFNQFSGGLNPIFNGMPKKSCKTPPLQKIYNSKTGEQILLNANEQHFANMLQAQMNSLGFEINITTLTTIIKQISEQKFFEVAPADYVPVIVGNGGWSTFLTTYRSFNLAGDFEDGLINTAGNNSRLATADAGVDSITVPVFPWAKESVWTIPEMEFAAKNGNWDIVTAKMESRKKNWDLGIQKIAFLGMKSNPSCKGLLTLGSAGVNTNTEVITKKISSMTAIEFNALLEALVEAYRKNANRTSWPDKFIIPESDYNGLTNATSPDFPLKTKLEFLRDSLRTTCKNPNFEILPLAYGDMAYSGLPYQIYMLTNSDPTSIRMDIPVPYTSTVANSMNSFQFQNVSYGLYTGVMAYRPLESLYFTYVPS